MKNWKTKIGRDLWASSRIQEYKNKKIKGHLRKINEWQYEVKNKEKSTGRKITAETVVQRVEFWKRTIT